jgi:glycosyltransferase involved in cell wall biosynthesis
MYGTVELSMINTDPLLSVVMPVYNERTTIEAIVRRVLALPLRLELIVVDDGSSDGSSEILDTLQRELKFTLLSPGERRQGLGASARLV